MRNIYLRVIAPLLLLTASSSQAAWPLLPQTASQLTQTHLTEEQQQSEQVSALLVGTFYYHYLNEDYQAAYNSLQRLRTDLPTEQHGTLDILETTLLLALGLDAIAFEQFNALMQRGYAAPAQAWFYLARRLFALGLWEETEQTLMLAATSAPPLNKADQQEALYMRASSLLEQDRVADAQRFIGQMEGRSIWIGLAYHNLLVGKIRNYASPIDIEKTTNNALYALPKGPEANAIGERIRLLAGIAMLDFGRFREADRYLQTIRLDSAYAAPSLLQIGWSQYEQGNFDNALTVWRRLFQQFQIWQPAVVESLLAVPYALEKMSATTQALRSYMNVDKRLQQMLDEIADHEKNNHAQQWLNDWLQQQRGDWGWRRSQVNNDPDSAFANAIMDLTARSDYRQQLAHYYDLHKMQNDLQQMRQHINLWEQKVAERKRLLERAEGGKRLAQLQKHYERLMPQVRVLEDKWLQEEQSLFAYASGQDLKHKQQVETIIPLVQYLQGINTPTRDLNIYKERWRRVRGVLLWNMYEQQPQRRWQVTSEFWQLRQNLDELNTQLTNTRLALEWSGSSWQGFAPRLAVLRADIAKIEQRITRLKAQQSQELQLALQTHLQQTRERLTQYQIQVRLSIARMHDDELQQQLTSAQAVAP